MFVDHTVIYGVWSLNVSKTFGHSTLVTEM